MLVGNPSAQKLHLVWHRGSISDDATSLSQEQRRRFILFLVASVVAKDVLVMISIASAKGA